jgi:hypothetical protein
MSILKKPGEFKKDGWVYKYVRFADGEVLFCDGADIHVSHKNIVDERAELPGKVVTGRPVKGAPMPPPVSAGMIDVLGNRWYICDSGSRSAHLTRSKSDEKYIEKELGHGFVYEHLTERL